ncbi:MAG: hypothetical protein ABEN55_03630 [Bradymonadaceae bacterium]
MSDEENMIRISTDELSVELRGPADRVKQGYTSLRHALLESFESTMHQRTDPDDSGATRQMYATGEESPGEEAEASAADASASANMSAADRAPTADAEETDNTVIQLVLHRRNYSKLRILERSELADSFLGRGLEASLIRRLYASPETVENLHDSLEIGGTLWRKLTPAGRREVARQSGDDSEETNE